MLMPSQLVLVLGHSLGSALAECLAYQLAGANSLGAARVGAIVYASPKLGDHDFVHAFNSQVTNYIVINFEHDVVPQVPPFDITHLDLYRPLPDVYVITDETALASVNPRCGRQTSRGSGRWEIAHRPSRARVISGCSKEKPLRSRYMKPIVLPLSEMWCVGGSYPPTLLSWIITDTAAKVVNPRHDAHLFNWCLVRARPRKQIGDLGELTFWLLCCGVEFLTKRLAGGNP